MNIRKVIRVFSIAFELFDKEGENKGKGAFDVIDQVLGNPLSNKFIIQDNKYDYDCEGENGKDIFTYICDPCDLELKDYLTRIASRKHNNLTEKGRNGLIHIGIGGIRGLKLKIFNPNMSYIIKFSSILHLDAKSPYNWKNLSDNVLNNIASVSFIIELENGDEEHFSEIQLKSIYVDLTQMVNNSQFQKTVNSITNKDKNGKSNVDRIIKWNFYYDKKSHKIDYNLITFRAFLLFYIWASFLENFRKGIYEKFGINEEKKNKYITTCRFINSITSLISSLSFESTSLSYGNKITRNELNADIKIFSEGYNSFTLENMNYWYDFLCRVFHINEEESWEKEFFKLNLTTLVKRDLEGAMYFQNIRVYPSYIDNWLPAIKNGAIDDEALGENNLRWDAVWGILLGDILCTMAETFILYNSDVEKHTGHNRRTEEIFRILEKASKDFAAFYDADIIQSNTLRETLEIAKKTFLINDYHDKLVERLRLFTNFEIQKNEQKLNLFIFVGGSIANVLLAFTLDFMLWVYHYHKIFRLAILIEVLFVPSFAIYYYFRRK